ncbi:hypothetical protein [Inhella sp.]|uniref:hypothetical protein n=1 Tax=Inhella sp. TaxID=1921806 RepID=UPI0035B31578
MRHLTPVRCKPARSGRWFWRLGAVLVLGGGGWPLGTLAQEPVSGAAPAVGPGAQPTAVLSAEALKADLAQFRTGFMARDRAYSPVARAEAERRLDALASSAEPMDATRLGLALAQVAALADNGHTLVSLSRLVDQSGRVPLRLVPFGDGEFRVLRAREPEADWLGARLVAIDDQPLERLRAAAHALVGGLPAWRDRSAPFLFESPQMLHALGLVADPQAARYRVQLDDGRTIERRLTAEPPGPTRPRADTQRLLLPEVTPPELGWRGVLALADAPWALREATLRLRWRAWPERQALVVDLRVANDAAHTKLADFLAGVNAALAEQQPRHLVIDLRQNGGGDLTKLRDFAESLPQRVPGRVFVLTSPWTFSAAISTLGYLKQAAPERVQIVGEPIGDRLVFFAEGRPLRLTHSGMVALMATERHDYRDGCRAFDDCHAPVRLRPIARPSLAPDLPVPWTFADYRAGRDPAMEAVDAQLR